jgi:hypothetical protein
MSEPRIIFAVIFGVLPRPDQWDADLDIAKQLRLNSIACHSLA